MTSWTQGMNKSKHSAIKYVNNRYHGDKHSIKQGQSLKNDSNEHITSECSSGHVQRSNHLWLLACPITQPMQNTQSMCI